MPNPVKSVIHKIRSPGSHSPERSSTIDEAQPHSAPAAGGGTHSPSGTTNSRQNQGKHAEDLRTRLAHLVPHSSRHSAELDRTGSMSPSESRDDRRPRNHSHHASGAQSPRTQSPAGSRRSFDLFGRHAAAGTAAGGVAGGASLSRFISGGSRKHKDDSDKASGKGSVASSTTGGGKADASSNEPVDRVQQKLNAKLERNQREEEEHEEIERQRAVAYEQVCAFTSHSNRNAVDLGLMLWDFEPHTGSSQSSLWCFADYKPC